MSSFLLNSFFCKLRAGEKARESFLLNSFFCKLRAGEKAREKYTFSSHKILFSNIHLWI
jgi:hypothetical protein